MIDRRKLLALGGASVLFTAPKSASSQEQGAIMLEGWGLSAPTGALGSITPQTRWGAFAKNLAETALQHTHFAHLFIRFTSGNFSTNLHGFPVGPDGNLANDYTTAESSILRVVTLTPAATEARRLSHQHDSLPARTLEASATQQALAKMLDMGAAINLARIPYVGVSDSIDNPPSNSNSVAGALLAVLGQCPPDRCEQVGYDYLNIGYPAPGINRGLAAQLSANNRYQEMAANGADSPALVAAFNAGSRLSMLTNRFSTAKPSMLTNS